MYKAQSLRKHLAATVPNLKRDPDKLSILVKGGRIAAAGEDSLSFEYTGTVQIVVLDYAGQPDAIMLPILVWLRTHQPEYFDNPVLREKAFRFEVDYNNATTVDLAIELDLTERVRVWHANLADDTPPGRYHIEHLGEPARPGVLPMAEHWEFWFRDALLAEWDYNPLETDQAPRLSDAQA